MKVLIKLSAVVLLLFAFSSCKEHQPDFFADVKGTYFSINKFILDEWTLHASEPLAFKKTVNINGKIDSAYEAAEQVDWVSVINTFKETEISDRKYLGQYTFSQYDDDFDKTHNFIYIANNKNLFTQKLLITIDINSMKVRGVYIETLKTSFLNETSQKLYYNPGKTIQIQRYERPKIGSKKDIIIKYESAAQLARQ